MVKVTRRKGRTHHEKRSKKKCRITKNGNKKCRISIPNKKSKKRVKRGKYKKKSEKRRTKGGLVFPSEYYGVDSNQYHKKSTPVKVCVKMV